MEARLVLFGSAALGLVGLAKVYGLTVRGALTLDSGIGRRVRPLGPIEVRIAADPDTVFDIVAAPYLSKTPHAMETKLRVVERGTDMVLAEHFTDVGRGQTAITVETVRFEGPTPSASASSVVRFPRSSRRSICGQTTEAPRSPTPARWVRTFGRSGHGGPTR